MEFEIDDPRLTAYALGELSSAEAAEVEDLLARNPAARFEVEQIRGAAGLLGSELEQEIAMTAGLSQDRKQAIAAAARDAKPTGDGSVRLTPRPYIAQWDEPRTIWVRPSAWVAAAAAVVLVVSILNQPVPAAKPPHASADDEPTFEVVTRVSPPTIGDHDPARAGKGVQVPSHEFEIIPPAPTRDEVGAAGSAAADNGSQGAVLKREPGPIMASSRKISDPRTDAGPAPRPDADGARPPAPAANPTAINVPFPVPDQSRDPIAASDPLDFIPDARFKRTLGEDARSAFSVEVGSSGFADVRGLLQSGVKPRPEAVRVEDLLNYFHWEYPAAQADRPIATAVEVAQCPWDLNHRLAFVALKARPVAGKTSRPGANLVFVVDLARTMADAGRLTMAKRALRDLVSSLNENDRVAVIAAGQDAVEVVPPTSCRKLDYILRGIDGLQVSAASKCGGRALEMGYRAAHSNLVPNGVNRVVLLSDGDFTHDSHAQGEWADAVLGREARPGVQLSVLAIGANADGKEALQLLTGRVEGTLVAMADPHDVGRSLVDQAASAVFVAAREVRVHVEFNPELVASYRLVGYTNRRLNERVIREQRGPSGELGAGDEAVALYEIIPASGGGSSEASGGRSPLRYQRKPATNDRTKSGEVLTLTVRFRKPGDTKTTEFDVPATDSGQTFAQASRNFRFAAGVAMFGLELCGMLESSTPPWATIEELARDAISADPTGPRGEFSELIKQARRLCER